MTTDLTPAFRFDAIYDDGSRLVAASYPDRKAGAPTDANLAAYVALLEAAHGDTIKSASVSRNNAFNQVLAVY